MSKTFRHINKAKKKKAYLNLMDGFRKVLGFHEYEMSDKKYSIRSTKLCPPRLRETLELVFNQIPYRNNSSSAENYKKWHKNKNINSVKVNFNIDKNNFFESKEGKRILEEIYFNNENIRSFFSNRSFLTVSGYREFYFRLPVKDLWFEVEIIEEKYKQKNLRVEKNPENSELKELIRLDLDASKKYPKRKYRQRWIKKNKEKFFIMRNEFKHLDANKC